MNGSDSSSVPSMGVGKDKYVSDKGSVSHSNKSGGNVYSYKSDAATNIIKSHDVRATGDGASVNTPTNSSYHVGLTSLLSVDDATIDSVAEYDIMDTELYEKFEEAFNMTLRSNPGILPGATTVIDSVKKSIYKSQKIKADKEREMRKQLDKVKSEQEKLETQLRKEMGTAAQRKNELSKELEAAKRGRDVLQDSLAKQTVAIEAVKRELTTRMNDVTKEKEELTNHLGFLSKSRAQLEQALETEMALVEKDRDALQKVVAERKQLQKQKMENKELEGKIEQMTHAASKEKRALQEEVTELKEFGEHISGLRKENEQSRLDLERERGRLKEIAETMQLKKATLMESKSELEMQYQHEIDELQGQIQNTKIMHETDMEMVVKNRVINYLSRGGDFDNVVTESVLGRESVQGAHDTRTQIGTSPGDATLDIESLINSRVEAELKKKMEAEEVELKEKIEAEEARLKKKVEAEEDKLKKKREAEEMKIMLEDEMRKKMESEERRLEVELKKRVEAEEMRLELELKKRVEAEERRMEAELKMRVEAEERRMEAKLKKKKKKKIIVESDDEDEEDEEEEESTKENDIHRPKNFGSLKEDMMKKERDRLREELEIVQTRNPRHSLSTTSHHSRDGIQEEITSFRDEIKMSQRGYSPTLSSHAAAYSAPLPRNAHRGSAFQRNNALISPRYDPYRGSGGGGSEEYSGKPYMDKSKEERLCTNRVRNRQFSIPPISQRSPRMQRGGTVPSSLNSRYYF